MQCLYFSLLNLLKYVLTLLLNFKLLNQLIPVINYPVVDIHALIINIAYSVLVIFIFETFVIYFMRSYFVVPGYHFAAILFLSAGISFFLPRTCS